MHSAAARVGRGRRWLRALEHAGGDSIGVPKMSEKAWFLDLDLGLFLDLNRFNLQLDRCRHRCEYDHFECTALKKKKARGLASRSWVHTCAGLLQPGE